MRLLERDEPLAALHRVRAASASGGRLVFVEGEAGVGKTSLLRAFRESLPPGTAVLLGSCDPLSTPRPLGPFVEIADDLDPLFAAALRDEAPREAVLGRLLAALRRPAPPLTLLLEDLHWADEATLDALRFIGRRLDTTRALIVGTYRDDEVGRQHPLRVVVGDLATSRSVERLPLPSLSVTAVAELARGSGLDPATLHQRTGGNPFYVTEVIAGAPAEVPATVRDAVLARAARLSPAARATLEAAAVIGATVEPALLARIVAEPAADASLANGLLVSDGRRYAFRHELARQAILDATDPSVRIRLHGRVLRALESRPAQERSPAVLAHHAEEAGDRAAVLRHAPQAARDAAAVGAHRQAAAQLARARPFFGDLADEDRGELLEAFAREHAIVARYDVVFDAWDEAITLWRRLGASRREVAALAEMAKALVSAGRNADAEEASRLALEAATSLPDGPERVEALNAQAYLRMLDRDNAEAVEIGRRAIDLGASEPQAAASVIQAWNTVGAARILLGDFDGVDDLATARRLATEAGVDRLAAGTYSVGASALGEMYRFADALPMFDAGLAFAAERDLDAFRVYLEAWLALVRLHRGEWSAVGPLAARVLADWNLSTISRIMALLALGRLRARRGDPDAWEALDEALALAAPTGTLQRIGPVRAARAEAAWLAGDPDRTAAEAASVLDLARSKSHPWHIGELSWWIARAGERAAAGLAPEDEARMAAPWRLQLAGRWREAADAWAALDCPYESARALLDADDVGAVEEGLATFDRLGARPAASLATRRLRELGATSIPRGPRATTRSNPAGLTEREVEVLRLLAAGLQNREIARKLFLSPRTVDHHVSAVLGKVGVARRGDAGAAAVRLGIDLQNGQSAGPD